MGHRPILGACLAGTLACVLACTGGIRDGLHLDLEYVDDGVVRTYHFFEAPGHETEPRPLVLLLHGGGAVIDNHIGVGAARWPHERWLDLAEEQDLHVVAPQGIDSHWNDCRTDCTHCGDQDDVGFLADLLDELSSTYGVDRSRVYVVGESNGGFLTQRLAQERPELFAAMGVVIAQMPANNGCTPSDTPIPIMYQVGTEDAAVPYEGGPSISEASGAMLSAAQSVQHWVDHNACEPTPTHSQIPDGPFDDGSTVELDDYDCPATGTGVAIYHMHGAGHVPPSIEYQVSTLWEAGVGPQNHDLEGADAFWEFFQRYTREQTSG